MKEKLNKIRGLIILLLLVVLSANSNLLFSIAKESEQSINTENIVATSNVVLEKYINYESETEKGLLMQYSVDVGTEYKNDENHVPLVATGLLFNAPKVENEFPETINIIAKSTLLTNGSDEGKDYKFVYKKETGAIAIVTSNNKNEEGNIYEEYKQNAKDSFSIILNYGENAYNSENKERNLSVTGRIVEILNTEEKTRIENSFENTQIVKENISKLVSTKVENTNVYNGYIKSNVVNGTNYETAYKENVQINISKDNLGTQKIDLTQKFINKNGEAIETENIVFKSSKMEKQNILDILGEEGTLKILDNQEQILKEINKDTESNEDGTIKINYPEGTTKITLELSNAVKTGNITIQNEKEIKAEEKNLELSKIQEIYNQDEITNIEIQDSKTEVTIEPSLTTWTNEKQNEVEFKVSLHNNSSKYNLFKNPVIAIQLPEETEKVLLNETATLTNANGLKIKNTEYNTENRTIRVELEGEQTKYLSPALEDGTIIKIPAVIILSNNIESKEIDLKSAYQNENNYTGNTETEVIKNKIILENFNQTLMPENTIQKMAKSLASAAPTSGTEESVVPTAQGIFISVKPVIGDVTRDTVYEGEFIKYEITATNTTNQDIDNVKIVATLPEGVTYTKLVTKEEDTKLVNSYEYDENNKNIEIELGKIKAGQPLNTFFEVKVNDLAEGENNKNISTKIKAFIGEGLSDEKNITHNVNKAEYKVFLLANEAQSNQIEYEITVLGNQDKEFNIKLELPECMEISKGVLGYVYSLDENGNPTYDQEMAKPHTKTILDGNVVSYSLKPGRYIFYARINTSKIERKLNESIAETKAVATINDLYKSNENRLQLPYESVTISITSDKAGEKVQYNDEINYEIKVTNIGRGNYKINGKYYSLVWITDTLPEDVKPIQMVYNKFELERDEIAQEIGFKETKDIVQGLSTRKKDENGNRLPDIQLPMLIPWKETVTINVKVKAGFVYKQTPIYNRAMVSGFSYEVKDENEAVIPHNSVILSMQTEEIKNIITTFRDPDIPVIPDEPSQPEQPDTPEEPNQPVTPDQPDIPGEAEEPEVKKYKINGYVWNDKNEDGEKQNDEQLLSGIQTYLINAKGEVTKETKTDNNGKYNFENIENGEYNVVFKYNTNQYRITKYKANGVSESTNSNATKQEVSVNGEKITAGVTEQITLNKDIENINLGLIENKKFDFKVDNYISKITVKTKNGTTETPYSKANLAKAEIKAKEVEGAVVTVEYKIVVTNNGELPGKVGKVIDYLPEGLNLASESISSWVKNADGSVINTSIANQTIEAGKSVELTLVATITMTENSTGTLTNRVKIEDLSNELNVQESSIQNNSTKSELILSISTGVIVYVALSVIIIIIILLLLHTKFNLFKNIHIKIFSILFILGTTIAIQGLNETKAYQTDGYLPTETKKLYLTSYSERWRLNKKDFTGNTNVWIYNAQGYEPIKVNIDIDDIIIKKEGSHNLYKTSQIPNLQFFDMSEEEWEELDYVTKISDEFYKDFERTPIGDTVNLSFRDMQSIRDAYVENDWRAFFELKEGETLTEVGDNWVVSDPPQLGDGFVFGTCLNHYAPGGYNYIYITNLYSQLPEEVEIKERDSMGNEYVAEIIRTDLMEHEYLNGELSEPINATEPVTYYREYTQNPSVDWVDEEEYPYIDEYPVDLNLMGNTDDYINVNRKNGDYLFGPFVINRNDHSEYFDEYKIEVLGNWGTNYVFGKDDDHICKANGSENTLGATGTFYIKLSQSEMDNLGTVTLVRASTDFYDEYIKYGVERIASDVWYSGDLQSVSCGYTTTETMDILVKQYGEGLLEWYKFPGAITIQKSDEIGKDENGNTLSMEGINFIVNKFNDGWAVYDNQGNITYGDIDSNHKPVIFTTDATGRTQTIVGFDTVSNTTVALEDGTTKEIMQNIDGSTYMAFEIIDDNYNGDGNYYGLPNDDRHLSDYYKATYSAGQLWGCPYSLKSLGNGNLKNFDGSNDSVYDDFDMSRQYYNPDTYPVEYFGEFLNGNSPIHFIYSGEFETFNVTNTRDYVSLQIDKKDHYNGTFDNNYAGIRFKVCKLDEDGTYKWVHKVNPSDPHSEVTYGSFNGAYELTTDKYGKTGVLKKLDNGGTYWIVETYIPPQLEEYYTLHSANDVYRVAGSTEMKYKVYFDQYNIDLKDSQNRDNKIKLLSSTANEFTLLQPKKIYVKKPQGETATNVVDTGYGKFSWQGWNPRDYFAIQIYKQNERNTNGNTTHDPLNDIEFAILEESKDSTESNYKGGWVATDNNGIYNSSLIPNYDSISNIRTARYITGENGENGYTRMVRRIPIPPLGQAKKYSIFEINASDYEDLYKLGQFRFNGTLKDGKCIETITINNEFKKDLWKEPTRTTNTNVKIYNVKLVNYTNIQDYGSLQIQKVDELTKTPLNNIGLRIRMQTGKWLIINDKKSGVINSNDTSKKEVTGFTDDIYEATEIRTNAQGYTDTIYKVPIDGYQMMNTYSAYETYIPENLRSYYALNSDFTKYAPSNCTAAQYRSFENAAIYELKATTVRSYLNTINSLRSQAGAAPIANLALTDVARLVAYGKITRDIDKNDITKPVITEFEAQNEQNYINISGYVWEDGLQGKNTTNRDSKKKISGNYNGTDLDGLDYNIQNIKVALMKRITFNGKSTELQIATTDTDANGKYSFTKLKLKDLANYYIKFTYDGITYQATDVDLKTCGLQTVTGSPTFASVPSSETSKATEVAQQRNTLNQAFKELTGEGQVLTEGKYNGVELDYNKKTQSTGPSTYVNNVILNNTYASTWERANAKHPKTVLIDNSSSRKYDFLIEAAIDKGTINNQNQSILLYYYNMMADNTNGTERAVGYKDNKTRILTEIPYLNLGLYRREQPNLTLQKDIYKADLSINDAKYTYMYNQKLKTAEAQTVSTAVDFDGDYSLPIYEADVYYGDTDKGSASVANSKQLQATITYKIKLQNASTNLYTNINQIKEYFPEEFTIDSARINGKMYALIYIMNTNTPTNADFTTKNNLLGIETINSYETVTGRDGKKYNKYTINLGDKAKLGIDKDTNTKYLYIQFKIDNEKLKTYYTDLAEKEKHNEAVSKIVSEFVNYAEISSYSVYSNTKMEPYAHVDSTSIPNSLEKNGLTIYEDDEDNAPGLKIVRPSQRNLAGIVFEDAPVQQYDMNNNGNYEKDEIYDKEPFNEILDPGEQRIGDGVTSVNPEFHFKDSNGDRIMDARISGVIVKLVDSDGKPAQFYDEETHKWKDQTYEIRSGNDGGFTMTGFVPGDYRVEFVWGKDAGGKDVSRYKCTILSNPNIINNDQYEGEIEYVSGYDWLNEEKRYSDAKDDYIRRLAIDMKALGVTKDAYKEGEEALYDKVLHFFDDKTGDNGIEYMHSTTPQFSVGVERNGGKTGITTDDQSKEMMINTFSGFDFNINKVDFGIIERPKRAMSVQKRIKSIKITTPEGRPVVIATIGIDGKVNAIAGEQYISGGYKLGYLYAQIDKNLQQSMKVEVEYEVAVSGLSELDYDYVGYYLYAIPKDGTELKLKATNLYDYVGGATITTDSKDEDRWQSAELTDEYLKVPTVGEINSVTATEKLIMDIFNYVPSGDTQKVGKQNKKEEVIKVIDEMGLYDNVDTLTNTITAKEAKETLAKIYTKLIDDWDNSEYKNQTELNEKIIRALKLKNREVVQGDPNTNTLVKDYYESTETRVGKIKISKIISNGEDIDLNNDIEIASVAVDTTQKTGANADPTYAPLYDRAEYVTVSPAQGEDKDYVGKAIVGIGILTVLASGIILIKRYVSSK